MEHELTGAWRVDLRPLPSDPPYYQQFTVDMVTGRTFTGTFYDTPIEQGRINADWGAVHIAFVTSDGSGMYHHSGVLRNGQIEGQSHALGRDHLFVWRAERTETAS